METPVGIPEDKLHDALVEKGFAPHMVIRMKRRRGGGTICLVLIKICKEFKGIHDLTEMFDLEISVEPLRPRPGVGQCHRCQLYEHGHSRCSAPVRCMACREAHFAQECRRPKSELVTCANCGGDHPASYRGCSRYPKIRAVPIRALLDTPEDRLPTSSREERFSASWVTNPARDPE